MIIREHHPPFVLDRPACPWHHMLGKGCVVLTPFLRVPALAALLSPKPEADPSSFLTSDHVAFELGSHVRAVPRRCRSILSRVTCAAAFWLFQCSTATWLITFFLMERSYRSRDGPANNRLYAVCVIGAGALVGRFFFLYFNGGTSNCFDRGVIKSTPARKSKLGLAFAPIGDRAARFRPAPPLAEGVGGRAGLAGADAGRCCCCCCCCCAFCRGDLGLCFVGEDRPCNAVSTLKIA